MAVRGAFSAGSTVAVTFRAPVANKGTAVVGSFWLGTEARDVQDSSLLPGSSATHRHTESGASALRLHLDVPAEGGVIEVTVTANGSPVDSGAADADTFWTYIVQ